MNYSQLRIDNNGLTFRLMLLLILAPAMKAIAHLIIIIFICSSCLKNRLFEEPKPTSPIDTVKRPASIVINEISSTDTPDWVELYNPGDSAYLLLKGVYYLSDSKTNPSKYMVDKDVMLPAKGYLIFECATGGAPTSSDHLFSAAFGLSSSGEDFTISKLDNEGNHVFIDSVSFPVMQKGQSYARIPDGANNWAVSLNPTKNSPNRP
jgi:hypothetical protein